MVLNHRYAMRVATDLALGLFMVFAAGAVLWMADEFLNWNVLPDWIDRYAQLIVVLFGIAAALAVATSLLCSVVLVAEAAAAHVGLPDYKTSPRLWRIGGGLCIIGACVFLLFYRIDAYRKEVRLKEYHAAQLAEYQRQIGDLQAGAVRVAGLFDEPRLRELHSGAVLEGDTELLRLMSAIRISIPHRPSVSVVIRAPPPYQFCHLDLIERPDHHLEDSSRRFALNKQFFIGFPTVEEKRVVDRLFAGEIERLDAPLEGEVLNNVRPSSWQLLRLDGKVVGLVVLKTGFRPSAGQHHSGPAAPP